MPVVALKPGYRIFPSFAYPSTGRVRIYLEATHPVDVFVSTPDQAPKITSVQVAHAMQVINFPQRVGMNEIVPLPLQWKNSGWALTIGHSAGHDDVIAVYFFVGEA